MEDAREGAGSLPLVETDVALYKEEGFVWKELGSVGRGQVKAGEHAGMEVEIQ